MIYYITNNIHYTIKNSNIVTDITVKEIINKLKDKSILAIDVETTSLDPRNGNIIMFQLGDGEDQYIIDTRCTDIKDLSELLCNEKVTYIGHNIKFDYNFLKSKGIILTNVYDTMIVDQVLYSGKYTMDQIRKTKRFSLKGVYKYYFNKDIEKDIRDDFFNIGNNPYTYKHILYGAGDVKYPFDIKEKQEKLSKVWNLEKCINLENKTVLAVGDIEYNGMYLNEDKWLQINEETKKKLLNTEIELDRMVLKIPDGQYYKKAATQLDLFTGNKVNNREAIINWNSDQQVLHVLNTVFNIYPEDKHGKVSSGADAIKFLKKRYPITHKILQYREEAKIVDSFGQKFIDKYLDKDNRVRTSYNQIISTGRMSSRNPNMQQIPRKGGFREAFIAPKGKLLCTADYDNQEGRVMADMSQDESYVDFFKSDGSDIHSFVSTKLFSVQKGYPFEVSKTVNPEYRQKGKSLNFMISYGGSAYGLSKELKISESEAQKLIDAFYQGFPQLKKFFIKSQNEGISKGYIRINNITNRIRWFGNWREYQELRKSKGDKSKILQIKGSIERRSQNTKIQGTSGDITKTALILLRDSLIKNNILPTEDAVVKIVNVIHDEIVIEADTSLIEKWSRILKECMEKAASIFCNELTIPADPIIKSYWTH